MSAAADSPAQLWGRVPCTSPLFACRERRVFHACAVMNFRNNRRPGETTVTTPTTDAGGESRGKPWTGNGCCEARVAGIGPWRGPGWSGAAFHRTREPDSGAAGGSTTAQQAMPRRWTSTQEAAANLGIDEQKPRDALKAIIAAGDRRGGRGGKLTQARRTASRKRSTAKDHERVVVFGLTATGGMGDRGRACARKAARRCGVPRHHRKSSCERR
jgi:hypothetical protein